MRINRTNLKKYYKNESLFKINEVKINYKKNFYWFLKRVIKKKLSRLLRTVLRTNKKKFLYSLCGVVSIVCLGTLFYLFKETGFTYLLTLTHSLTCPRLKDTPELPNIIGKCPVNIEIEDVKEVLSDEKNWFYRHQKVIFIWACALTVFAAGGLYFSFGGVGGLGTNPFNSPDIPVDLNAPFFEEDSDISDAEETPDSLKKALSDCIITPWSAIIYLHNCSRFLHSLYIIFKPW